jgi:hypothetical protein
MAFWYILLIFYSLLEYSVVFLAYFSIFGMLYQEKSGNPACEPSQLKRGDRKTSNISSTSLEFHIEETMMYQPCSFIHYPKYYFCFNPLPPAPPHPRKILLAAFLRSSLLMRPPAKTSLREAEEADGIWCLSYQKLQIFVTGTFFIFVTFNKNSLVGQVFCGHFELIF